MVKSKLLEGLVLLGALLPIPALRAVSPEVGYEKYVTTKDLMKKGVLLLNERKLNDAKATFEQCLKQVPDHYEARFFLGALAYENRDYAAALEHIQTAIQSLENLGKAYDRQSLENQKRIAAAREAVQLALDTMMIRSGGGSGGCNASIVSEDRMALQELDQAAASPFSGEKAFGIPAVFYCLKGNCLLRLRRNADSREQYEKAVLVDPKYTEAWNNLAYLWFADHDPDQALEILQRAGAKGVTINPALKQTILDAAKTNTAN
jgi:tetratricopeptide (TPR) repeat protein